MKEWNEKAEEKIRKEEMIEFDKAKQEFNSKALLADDGVNEVEISEEENAPDFDFF
jgi:hypothetical protein